MPQGYLVQLGDMSLDAGDGIVFPLTDFLIQEDLGTGEWIWSGTWNGTTFTNEVEPGQYYLATDGDIYFVPAFGPVDTLTSASVETDVATDVTTNDGIVGGTGGDDVIDTGYTDSDGDTLGAPDDTVIAGDGDDSVDAGIGADTITGGGGADTLLGGDGDDVIHGGNNGAAPVSETLNWDALAENNADLSGGFTLNTGEMDVTVGFVDDGNNNPIFEVDSTTTNHVGTGEPFDPRSSLFLFGQGDGATSTTTIDFAASSGSVMSDEVQNVEFRINDVDWGSGNHRDILTINAFDAEGTPVAVTITPGGGQTVSGNTVTSDDTATSAAQQAGSVLIEIAGPVASLEIIYENGLTNTQGVNVTDLHFDTIVPTDGADSIVGGLGADSIFGEAGNDTIQVAQGDTVSGGDGDDYFILADLGEAGSGTIDITGGEGGETDGDTLQLTPDVTFADINFTNMDDAAGGLSGNFIMDDGTLVNFNEIENIICFTPGIRLLTEGGERAIETLRPGDRLITRDRGPQPIRWIGASMVSGLGDHAPIHVAAHSLQGARRPLLVSPQHRFLFSGYDCDLHFGQAEVFAAATHLEDGRFVRRAPCPRVTYIHLMLDRHEVIYAEGTATESFHAGPRGLAAISDAARDTLFKAFPALRSDPGAHGSTARTCLKAHEARMLMRPGTTDLPAAA